MSYFLIIVPIDNQSMMKIIPIISQQLLDRGSEVEIYSHEDAPGGVNLNRFDGFMILTHFFPKKYNSEMEWFVNNYELLKWKESIFVYIDNDSNLSSMNELLYSSHYEHLFLELFCLRNIRIKIKNDCMGINPDWVAPLLNQVEAFASVVDQKTSCGLSFQNQLKREYLSHSVKLDKI